MENDQTKKHDNEHADSETVSVWDFVLGIAGILALIGLSVFFLRPEAAANGDLRKSQYVGAGDSLKTELLFHYFCSVESRDKGRRIRACDSQKGAVAIRERDTSVQSSTGGNLQTEKPTHPSAGERVSKNIGVKGYVTSYYTPIRGQAKYFNGSYESDYYMNCSGDCFLTASGKRYEKGMENKFAACDNSRHPFGTKFRITMPSDHAEHPNESIVVECVDTGGAIEGTERIDLWAGIGTKEGYPWIGEWSSKRAIVEKL